MISLTARIVTGFFIFFVNTLFFFLARLFQYKTHYPRVLQANVTCEFLRD